MAQFTTDSSYQCGNSQGTLQAEAGVDTEYQQEERSQVNNIFAGLAILADSIDFRKMDVVMRARLCAELRKRNEPHHLGTVNEIVARYAKFGVTKSEVRRQKAAGTLDAYLESFHQK